MKIAKYALHTLNLPCASELGKTHDLTIMFNLPTRITRVVSNVRVSGVAIEHLGSEVQNELVGGAFDMAAFQPFPNQPPMRLDLPTFNTAQKFKVSLRILHKVPAYDLIYGPLYTGNASRLFILGKKKSDDYTLVLEGMELRDQ